jgi:hypothetical protein
MKRIYVVICLALGSVGLYAQTPVEDLIDKYRKSSGASCVSLSGFELTLARPDLQASPIGPVASDVQKLMVLHMDSTANSVRDSFEKNLYGTLGAYERYGQHKSSNGMVEIYAKFLDEDHVSELVIFNPNLWIVNDIHGYFSLASLEKLEKE